MTRRKLDVLDPDSVGDFCAKFLESYERDHLAIRAALARMEANLSSRLDGLWRPRSAEDLERNPRVQAEVRRLLGA
jgi:hypothetical protein